MTISERPWGTFEVLYQSQDATITVKLIKIHPKSRLSLQHHHDRSEEWICLSGHAVATVDGQVTDLLPRERVTAPRTSVHRLESDTGAEVLELAFGHFDENDIVRIEDDYSRT